MAEFINNQIGLNELLEILERQNEILAKSRFNFLSMEASRKHFEAKLINKALGKSIVEKTTLAQSTVEWLKFHPKLAKLESIYEFERLKMSIMEKAWQSSYLTMKLDQSMILKQQ